MMAHGEAPGGEEDGLGAWIRLILSGLPSSAAWPPNWAGLGYADYLYRERTFLVRDADVDRVGGLVPYALGHRGSLRGLTRLELPANDPRSVEEVCAAVGWELGEGAATPDHILYLCLEAEPEEVPAGAAPDPGVSTGPDDGDGVLVAVLDSGLLPGANVEHSWLAGVVGDVEPLGGDPPYIPPYAGHGTFGAGVVRTMAPKADVWVSRTFASVRAAYESDVVVRVFDAVKQGAAVISLPFGAFSRNDNPLLGFEILEERLRSYPSVALVAAAGNDASRRPFWPAAFPWVMSVGALSASRRGSAPFSNYGTSVDVFAPGEGLVNAYATGPYICSSPPNVGQVRNFAGMARWSGTSFSASLVAGLVAARASTTGETGRTAAAFLLQVPQAQMIPGAGLVLFASEPEARTTRQREVARRESGLGSQTPSGTPPTGIAQPQAAHSFEQIHRDEGVRGRKHYGAGGMSTFVSYAHEDEPYLKELEISFAQLRRSNLISTWHDRKIPSGAEWSREIDENLNSADIILLLVSRDFLASEYIYTHELPRALELHESGSAIVVPIILKPSDWENSPLGSLQVLPSGGRAVSMWRNRDMAWQDITQGVRRLIPAEDEPLLNKPNASRH
jgi:hypothetical protein